MVPVDWDTVGRIISRVCTDEVDPDRLRNPFEVGTDEVSWRKQHRYLTLVADHIRGQVVWAPKATARRRPTGFVTDFGRSRSSTIEVISLATGSGYVKSPVSTLEPDHRDRTV